MKIKAFRAYRPLAELASKVAELPYDVMNTKEALAIAKENPYSFLWVDKPEIDSRAITQDVYTIAKDNLHQLISSGVLLQEQMPAFYIYGLGTPSHMQYGIVGCFSCEAYDAGKIKKHENTRADKEQDRMQHVAVCGAQTGPIFLAWDQQETLRNWIHSFIDSHLPDTHFTGTDQITHTIYMISKESDLMTVLALFDKIPALYIADGHHRAAAACAYARKQKEENPNHTGEESYNYFLGVAFGKEELTIMDYNRVLKDESGLTAMELVARIEEHFIVEKIEEATYQPTTKKTFGMRYQGDWYKLSLKDTVCLPDCPTKQLDVAILQDYILEPIFHITNPKEDKRIDFVGGIRGIMELNKRTQAGDMDIAFSLYPTSMDQLIAVANKGLLMPPKSTWFEPKLRSGLFVHKID